MKNNFLLKNAVLGLAFCSISSFAFDLDCTKDNDLTSIENAQTTEITPQTVKPRPRLKKDAFGTITDLIKKIPLEKKTKELVDHAISEAEGYLDKNPEVKSVVNKIFAQQNVQKGMIDIGLRAALRKNYIKTSAFYKDVFMLGGTIARDGIFMYSKIDPANPPFTISDIFENTINQDVESIFAQGNIDLFSSAKFLCSKVKDPGETTMSVENTIGRLESMLLKTPKMRNDINNIINKQENISEFHKLLTKIVSQKTYLYSTGLVKDLSSFLGETFYQYTQASGIQI